MKTYTVNYTIGIRDYSKVVEAKNRPKVPQALKALVSIHEWKALVINSVKEGKYGS